MEDKNYKKIFVVKNKHLATTMESGTSPVLSTPALLCFMENTCMDSILHILNKDENKTKTCVGVKCELRHLKPCVIGNQIECISELTHIEKKRYFFKIRAYYKDKLIGVCDHIRCLVPENFYKI